jgi:non-canonical (house-cleaning) NTP pyrophosphatase
MSTIYVCGKSQLKLDAVRDYVREKGFSYHTQPVEVSTNVFGFPEQPIGVHEGEGLALLRISLAIIQLGDKVDLGDLIVSFENFIRDSFNPKDEAYCIVRNYLGQTNNILSEELYLPKELWQEYKESVDRDKITFGKFLKDKGVIADEKDPHLSLCGKSRKKFLKEALENAINLDSDILD